MTWSTLNLWWAFNLVILVWWLGIRLMSLLAPGLQISLLLSHMFTMCFWVTCHHLITFHLNQGVGIYSFLDQAVADFEQGLDCILTDFIKILELDPSFDEPGVITSFIFSGFLHSLSTISDTSKLQLAPSIESHKLWCQSRALLALCLWSPRCQHLKWFSIFLGTQQHLGSCYLVVNISNR